MEKFFVHNSDWQTPAKTEQYVYECLRKSPTTLDGYVYIAFPWASLFDGLARKTNLGEKLLKEFNSLTQQVKTVKNKRVVTVCQHIKFKQFHKYFSDIGITDLFVSHKEKNQTNLGGMNLYPLQIFPVQADEDVKNTLHVKKESLPPREKKYLYSFVGAYDKRYYLTDTRQKIFENLKSDKALITERLSWHFEARVYDEQIYGKKLSEDYLSEEQKNALEYIDVLKNSVFSLCPSGTGPNSIRLWESIEYGSIPVILADTLDLPGDIELWKKACVFISESEEDIIAIPSHLEKLFSNETELNNKLQALNDLKNMLGLSNFTDHIINQLTAISGITPSAKKITLNTTQLDKDSINLWLCFLADLSEACGIAFDVEVFESTDYDLYSDSRVSYRQDFSEDFVFLFDSKTLSHAILNNFNFVHIFPKDKPDFINHTLYPVIKSKLAKHDRRKWVPLCTLITSMFNGDEYLESFLDNVDSYSNLDEVENFVFRPSSRGNEHYELLKFGIKNSSLVYFFKAKDPGLYDIWNLGVKLSTSAYCSNANIDDKRAPTHITELVTSLDENKNCIVASSALRVTDIKNQSWFDSANEIVWYKPNKPDIYGIEKLSKYDETLGRMKSHNIPHCMPVWRTSLHREHGYFSEKDFGPSSDWEFWLRCGFENKKFFLLNKDLGLYYRAPQSYWRRDPNAKNFDEAIVNEYFIGEQLRDKPLFHGLKSKKFSLMIDAFSKDDYWIGLNSLYKTLQAGIVITLTEKKLVKLICERILAIDYDYLLNATARLSPVSEIKSTFFDFLGFYLRGLSIESLSGPLFNSLIDLADKIITADDTLLGWIAKAKIYNILGLSDKEALCLAEAYGIDGYSFWCNVNRLYGLEKSLSYFIERLSSQHDVPKISEFKWLSPGSKLYFLPDYSHGNPYQKLLYQNFKSCDVEVIGLSELESVDLDVSLFKHGDVLHIHWINILFRNQTVQNISARLSEFLFKIMQLKAKGVKIIWTVHNRQNHEILDIEIEYKFRNELSALCDIVLLHHPMIKTEISQWLASSAKIEIVEHGLYDDYYPNTISNEEARAALGIDQHALTIATLGLIREYKELPEKISALRVANESRDNPHHYVLAGKISCSKTLAEISKGPKETISVFNEFVPNDKVQLYMNAADYILLSYKDILTSGSFFQAMTFKKLVISPAKGTLNYYVADGVNGFVYENINTLYKIFSLVKRYSRSISRDRLLETYPCWPQKT